MIRRLGLDLADFDGCRFGVEAKPGILALKPWTVATSRPALAARLRGFRCTRDHPRGQLSGKAATRSGHYTKALCNVVLEEIALDSAKPSTERTYGRARLLRARGWLHRAPLLLRILVVLSLAWRDVWKSMHYAGPLARYWYAAERLQSPYLDHRHD